MSTTTTAATPLFSSSSSSSSPHLPKKAFQNPTIIISIFSITCFFLLFLSSYPQNICKLPSILKELAGFQSTAVRSGPILASHLTTCGPAIEDNSVIEVYCCPPAMTANTTVVEFQLPPPPKSIRVRRAAHIVDEEYVAKFSRAIQLMKELPDDDPRSFKQQSDIHCAFCNGGYHFLVSPETPLDIHGSWLFYPFHRFYLYFFERILQKLINDPEFSLPYWSWDSPNGMRMPVYFTDTDSPLYDALRSSKHQPLAVIDINFNGTESMRSDEQQMYDNLVVMYRQIVSGARTPELFFGSSYHPGDQTRPGMGSFESYHNRIHIWVGDGGQPHLENMGAFYSAARDPIFFSHHPNIDRLWTIWKTLEGGREDLTSPDWLDSEFMFYDEEARLVKVKIKDSLDTTRLGYMYEEVDVPWLNTRPTPRLSTSAKKKKTLVTTDVFPIKLDKVVRVLVRRRTKMSKNEQEELLVVEGIEMAGDMLVMFDVIVNDGEDEEGIGPANSEFAGSFVNLASLHAKKTKTTWRLGISELLRDLGAVEDESVLVTLVPKYDTTAGYVNIGGLKIE